MFLPPRKPLLALTAITIVLLAFAAAHSKSGATPASTGLEGRETLRVYCDGANISVPTEMVREIVHYWIHSVEGTPIIEHYIIRNGTLILVEAEAQSFGAGHPYNSEEIGGNETRFENGMIVYTAWYPIGDRLEILGNKDYNASITIVTIDGGRVVCAPFVHAIIEVVEDGRP